MPITRYDKAKVFLQRLKEEKGELIPFPLFLKQVKMKIGAHEKKTTRPYIQLMMEFDLIKAEGENVRIQ